MRRETRSAEQNKSVTHLIHLGFRTKSFMFLLKMLPGIGRKVRILSVKYSGAFFKTEVLTKGGLYSEFHTLPQTGQKFGDQLGIQFHFVVFSNAGSRFHTIASLNLEKSEIVLLT